MRTLLLVTLLACPALAADQNWPEILGPTQSQIPAPRLALDSPISHLTFQKSKADSKIPWETDLTKALAAAQKENRPVFVTFRCLPCKACSDFDKGVLEGGADLDPLLLQFITVRLISASDVDLRLLPMEQYQDMDVSWWGWFLSPQGRVYSVFGGRDVNGDAARTSKAGLIAAMKRVLDHHYDPRREKWDVDGPLPKTEGNATTPKDLAGYDNWLGTGRRREHHMKQECIHCHQVQEIMHQTAIDAKMFDKKRDTLVWPFPENVGMSVERDDGVVVKQVRADSPAAKAGLKAGDVLGAADGRRLFSQADFRAVLHRGPKDAGAIDLIWLRGSHLMSGKLNLDSGWRVTNNNWRISLAEGVIGADPGFWAYDETRKRKQLGLADDAMCISAYIGGNPDPTTPSYAAGLRHGDIITAVNGKSANVVGRQWMVWFHMNFEKGEEITLSVIDKGGKKKEVKFKG